MALTAPTFTVRFDADVESATFNKFVLTITNDFAGEGIAPSDVSAYFNVFSPVGAYHLGNFTSPDIPSAATPVYNTLALLTDSIGDLMEGGYTFDCYIRVAGAVQPGNYSSTGNTYNFCPVLVPVSLTAPIEGAVGCIEYENNCFCRQISIQDTTDVGVPTTDTRVFSVYPPPSLGLPAYTTNSGSFTYQFMYTGGYQIQLNRLLTYVTEIFTYAVRIDFSVYDLVNCDLNFGALINCYNTYRSETLTKAGEFGGFFNLPKQDLDKWLRITGGILAFDENLKFGNFTEADAAYNELKKLLACTCSCDDDTPRLVNPYCSGSGSNSAITVVTAGAGITVSSVVVGDTTTYTVAVQQATLDQIATNTTDIATLQAEVAAIIAGTTGQNYRLLESSTAQVGTDASTATKDLISYSVPAGTMTTDGDIIRLKGTVSLTNDANAKTTGLWFGASQLALAVSNNAFIVCELWAEITRTGATTQTIEWSAKISGGLTSNEYGTQLTSGAETLSGAIIVKLTGRNAVATANQIISKKFTVEYCHKA